jgi:hypothetical protein
MDGIEKAWGFLKNPKGADFAEFSLQARHFYEGVPGVRQGKVTMQGAKRR